MGTYNLPRNVKGENRILFIFTNKSIIYTVAAGMIGLLFSFLISLIFSSFDAIWTKIIIFAIFALLGYGIGTLKVPEISKFEFSKKTGGENIDDIIKRAIKFKTKGKKIYIQMEGKNND